MVLIHFLFRIWPVRLLLFFSLFYSTEFRLNVGRCNNSHAFLEMTSYKKPSQENMCVSQFYRTFHLNGVKWKSNELREREIERKKGRKHTPLRTTTLTAFRCGIISWITLELSANINSVVRNVEWKNTTTNPNVRCIEQEIFCYVESDTAEIVLFGTQCRDRGKKWCACSQCGKNRPGHLWKFSSPINLFDVQWIYFYCLADICGAFDSCRRDRLGLSNHFYLRINRGQKRQFRLY